MAVHFVGAARFVIDDFLPGVRAVLETEPKGVSLTLYGGMPRLSPSPVLESQVVLHDSRAYDIDLTLREGRVLLANNRDAAR